MAIWLQLKKQRRVFEGLGALALVGLLAACGGGGSTASSAWSGTKQLGAAGGSTRANSVATDSNGNVYVAGITDGGLDGNTLTGTLDAFLTKYDNNGNKQYTRQYGAAGKLTLVYSVATDTGGNAYVAGSTDGGLDGNTLTGTTDAFLTKYDNNGNKQYTRQFGVAGQFVDARSVATDVLGNVYVVGVTSGGLDGNTLIGLADYYLTKYNSSGVKQYTKQLGKAGISASAMSVATTLPDANGVIYVFVAGYTNGGLDGNTQIGVFDLFLAKFNGNGGKYYTKQLGAAGAQSSPTSVAADASGNVYVAGYTQGGLDGNTLAGIWDAFLVKYSGISSIKQYTKQFGLAGKQVKAHSVATDVSGNVYVAGYTLGGLDGNTSFGAADFFLTKYDNAGVKQYTRQLGAANAGTFANAVATDADGNVFVAGETGGGLDGNTLMGNKDLFVTKYNSAGVKQ